MIVKSESIFGFTLIELLIVIALLGALAVGLIGALDPFEQLKKGTDTGTRDLASQVHTAVIRYYAIKNQMPWCDNVDTCNDPSGADLTDPDVDAGINRMRTAGELKDDFKDIHAGTLDKIFITSDSSANTIAVCYRPSSKSFRADPNTKFDVSGVLQSDPTQCEGNEGSGGTKCYWCIQ